MSLSNVLSQAFAEINWLAVVVATLSAFAVGSVWYHEKILGTRWMKTVGLKKKDIEKANMIKTFGLSLVSSLITTIFLSVVLILIDVNNAFDGGLLGGAIGLFFVATTIGMQYLFAQRSFDLFVIDASYAVISFSVIGAIIGVF